MSDGALFAAARRVSLAGLLSLDPDLAAGLDDIEAERAERALAVHVARLPAGPWRPRLVAGPGTLGLLIADGLIVREIESAGAASAELLGAGDVIRPLVRDDQSLLAARAEWFVAGGATVAVLGSRVTATLARWPCVTAELFDRALRRSQTQAMLRSAAQLRRLDHRTLLYLWHTAERFGRVTSSGVSVRLPLTHEKLAALVGAHRPSFTTSLRKLERSGLLMRGDDHEYVLTGEAGAVVRELAGRAAAVAA